MNKKEYFGRIIIIGSTNVGKSTLINQIIGKKISITSHKINTTQKNIVGIYTNKNIQYEIIDSPGFLNICKKTIKKIANNIYRLIDSINLIIFLVSNFKWSESEAKVLKFLQKNNYEYVFAINKIDLIKKKSLLLPYINNLKKNSNNKNIFLISAKKGIYIENLLNFIKKKIPVENHRYKNKEISKNNKKFFISEIIRGELINILNKEIPYNISVNIYKILTVNKYEDTIYGFIIITKKKYKKIIIGCQGQKIKLCGIRSRIKLEKYFNKKIHLKLWIKVSKKK